MQYDREDTKNLLILQYSLHEVMYHPEGESLLSSNTFVEPKAHTVSDIYKCLHQGIFGIGHNIMNPVEFARRLAYDLEDARAAPPGSLPEPLFERVSPDGVMLRVNLRPLRRAFMGEEAKGCEVLLEVCLHSASMAVGSPKRLFAALEAFRDLNKTGELEAAGRIFAFPEETVNGFLEQVEKIYSDSGLVPVLSHSPAYRHFNRPSYRVVHLEALLNSPLAFVTEETRGVKSGNGN